MVSMRGVPARVKLLPQSLPLGGTVTLGSVGILGSVVVPSHAQHILRAVVELREAVELTVGVVDGGLVDAAEGAQGLVGAVEERLQNLSALVKVSRASQMQLLRRWTDFIPQVCGKTRVQEGRLCGLAHTLTQQLVSSGGISNDTLLVSLPRRISSKTQEGGHVNTINMLCAMCVTPQVELCQ